MCLPKNRKIKETRIYCECYEQGLYLLDYIKDNKFLKNTSIKIVYTKPGNFSNYYSSSIISQILFHKDFDGLISLIDRNACEHPLVGIEFSSAVPTDDHILQRFDVMYWSMFYKIPCIKISPTKMKNTDFGGGNKVKIQHEYYTTLNMKGIYYHIEWPLIEETDLVMTDNEKISCPPKLSELKKILNGFVHSYCKSKDENDYYDIEYHKYDEYVRSNYKNDDLDFSNSSRFQFASEGNVTIKFNRFGHGMDPERGMLLFWSQRLSKKPTVKFVVQRENRKKYKSLYEGNNESYSMNVIDSTVLPNNNIVTFDIAYDLFKKATNTEELFEHAIINGNTVTIDINDLNKQLEKSTSVVNNLLHFGNKIVLVDMNDNIIVDIRWDGNIVDAFYINERKKCLETERKMLEVDVISNYNINEDIVTYACMSLFFKNNMKNIAVSYPGAQGDRKLLQGNGVTTKRDYVDIISICKQSNNEFNVFLQENKKKISQTQRSDIDKLNSIKSDPEKMRELNQLITKIYAPIIIKGCYVGVGGQTSSLAQGEARFDYLMYIMINEQKSIEWQILSSNPIIFELFKGITNGDNSLKGVIELEYPMYFVE